MKSFIISVATAAMLAGGSCMAFAAQTGATAAAGNDNQAIATTTANATTPAHGANSFTLAQARTRIETDGFSDVSGLTKDNDGVWHAQAQKNGTTTPVWLDYRGNVGEGQ